MHVPLSWLTEFVPTSLSSPEIAEGFTLAGIEVDKVARAPLSFVDVVVGEVVECVRHEGADSLRIATVSDGSQTYQVVCGAPNCRKGLKTAFARVGAILEDETGNEFKIKRSKIRMALSEGMLCSPKELGLSNEAEGILELDAESIPGTDLADLFGDEIFEISLTPNLGHCFSVLGLSRELSAITGESLSAPDLPQPSTGEALKANLKVTVEEVEGCPRYACMLIRGVSVGPSPDWLQRKIERSGLRCVNNVVDAANYVMLELGQPLHTFDFQKIEGKTLSVRSAKKGERLVTLEGAQRTLTSELLICDASGPIAIAGVMGGQSTEVSDATTDVLIEAAYFDPLTVRRSSHRLNLKTDASKRFERGTDPNMVTKALQRAAFLIQKSAGGDLVEGCIDIHRSSFPPRHITCRASRVNQILGVSLSIGEMEELLQRLRFAVLIEGDTLEVTIPTDRSDLRIEIDLIEEIGRLYGFNNIVGKAAKWTPQSLPHSPLFCFEREIRQRLISLGLQEIVTNTLVGPQAMETIDRRTCPKDSWVQIVNPVSNDHSLLRQSLLPSMLSVVERNERHGCFDLRCFEIGTIHSQQEGQYEERAALAIALTGNARPPAWDAPGERVDFYDMKGLCDALLEGLQMEPWDYQRSNLATFHPGRQASIFCQGALLGMLGEVHPQTGRLSGITRPVLFATLDLRALMARRNIREHAEPLPQFPGSYRDWTVTLQEELPAASAIEAIQASRSRLLQSIEIIALYRSDQLGKDWKNVTFRLVYRDEKKTLSLKGVDKEHQRITANAVKQLGERARH